MPLAEEDVHKTAFSLPDGSYKVLRMPFGMVNSSATLMRAMRILLEGIENVEHVVDDILIHTVTWEENLGTLQELLQRMSAASLTARPSKTVINAHVIDFAGYRVGCGVTSPLEENLRKIRDAQRPRTKKEIRSFIGLTGFYRDYVANYSAIAAPLTDLTRKGKPNKVEWGDAQERSYQALKGAITSWLILHLPDHTRQFVLRTDASEVGIGTILMQRFGDRLFLVTYISKKLFDRERRFSTIERKCLALVRSIQKLRMFLYGQKFVLQTDHRPLSSIKSSMRTIGSCTGLYSCRATIFESTLSRARTMEPTISVG